MHGRPAPRVPGTEGRGKATTVRPQQSSSPWTAVEVVSRADPLEQNKQPGHPVPGKFIASRAPGEAPGQAQPTWPPVPPPSTSSVSPPWGRSSLPHKHGWTQGARDVPSGQQDRRLHPAHRGPWSCPCSQWRNLAARALPLSDLLSTQQIHSHLATVPTTSCHRASSAAECQKSSRVLK